MGNNMNIKDLNKPININNIDFRIQSISAKGWATFLAYKDARYDMNILDDVVGQLNWKKSYSKVGDMLICSVSIWDDEKKEWVSKEDTGNESNMDAQKGHASDSFKRACFNWGIGRELYSFPLIIVKLHKEEYEVTGNKVKSTFKLRLKEWRWELNRNPDNSIKSLQCWDNKYGYRWGYIDGKNKHPEWVFGNTNQHNNELSISDAVKAVVKCKSIDELNTLWSNNKKHQSHEVFINACTDRKNQLKS